MDANQSPCPRWADLTGRIQYAIVHDMTRTRLLSEVVSTLVLSEQQVTDLLQLVEDERVKHQRFDQLVGGSLEFPLDGELGRLHPVTEGITGREVGRGRAFLRHIGGAEPVAAALSFWQGTSGDFHDIPVDEGCLELAAPARGAREEELARRAPPANTVDPRGLDRAALPSRAEGCEETEMPPPGDLRHMRRSGEAASVSDQPNWPASEPIPEENLAVEGLADPEPARPAANDAPPASPRELAAPKDVAAAGDPHLLLGPVSNNATQADP